jgi:hypothetical protein
MLAIYGACITLLLFVISIVYHQWLHRLAGSGWMALKLACDVCWLVCPKIENYIASGVIYYSDKISRDSQLSYIFIYNLQRLY